MNFRRSLLVLCVFLVASIVLTWTVVTTLERGVGASTSKFSALFTNVSGLRVGDDVRMAGIRVGRVEHIDLDGVLARVDFSVQSDQAIYGNTKASVTYQNLIGQRYLGLSLDRAGNHVRLAPGARIPVERTEPSFDVSALLNGFEPLFGTLDPRAVDNITDALIKALQGDNGSIATLIAQTTQLAQSFAGPDQVLGEVITNLSGVVDNLSRQSGNLTTVIEQTRKLFEGLNSRRDALLGNVDRLSSVVDRAARTAAADQDSVRGFLERDPGYSQHIVDNRDRFAFLAYNLPLLLKGLARISQNGAYLNGYLCDVSFTMVPGLAPLIPEIVDAVTPGGAVKHSARCR